MFWKIFLWFWGAMMVIALALYLLVLTTRPDPMPAPWRETEGAALAAYASTAAATWERSGQEALTAYLDKIGDATAHYFLWDAGGRELSGHPLALNVPANLPPPDPNPLRDALRPPPGPPRLSKFNKLRHDALETEEAVFELDGPYVLTAQSINSPTGRRYILLGILPRPQFGRPAADPRAQWLGILLVLGLSSLVCYGLVRHLTAPMITLRAATRQLAAGDLTARTHAGQHARRDEIADLGRDFDLMAERIEGLVQAQHQLLGDISHELRSPLSRLSMALALARRQAESGVAGDEMQTALNRIGRETTRLTALIGQLLELARLESGETATECAVVDLQEIVREVVADANFEARFPGRRVQITHSQPCVLTGTRMLLHSAVENVVRNAVRYTAPGTAVEVSLACKDMVEGRENTEHVGIGTYAIIQVRDHGPGVPEAALSELFRPFYRVEDARDRESGGVGLGLAITDRAVRSHGGTVTATNAKGGGLQIELRLPVVGSGHAV